MKDNVTAIIIAYNDFSALYRCIETIYSQADRIFIVDNSTNNDRYAYRDPDKKIDYFKNKTNIGLANALNIGINKALEIKNDWILLLDQDAVSDENMVSNMIRSYNRSADKNLIAQVVPVVYDKNSDNYLPSLIYNKFSLKKIFTPKKDAFVDFQITSGTLVKKNIFSKIGFMDGELFIDYIDFDFCFRLREKGYKILLSHNALLRHSLGKKSKNLFFEFTEHNSMRVFYQIRNRLIIMKRFRKRFPFFCISETKNLLVTLLKIILAENNKIEKIINYFKGLYTFILYCSTDGYVENLPKYPFGN
ncbi:glycosyltransferase family 2 protein [Desulfonema magnum]|uniref:Glycosyltransferase domain-containing protein n=1 Tax=Desulfonema magnum TaxID=45655 RepID=A0A975GP50_9BACT|nr:glycosyltransferase family 2 protein [Desulfonema magnum]QTA88469.1 Glycosyltransferase domain-containing protein [Desulfonema magnum]